MSAASGEQSSAPVKGCPPPSYKAFTYCGLPQSSRPSSFCIPWPYQALFRPLCCSTCCSLHPESPFLFSPSVVLLVIIRMKLKCQLLQGAFLTPPEQDLILASTVIAFITAFFICLYHSVTKCIAFIFILMYLCSEYS